MKRKKWTKSEEERVKKLAEKYSFEEISEKLANRRSPRAIEMKLTRLGYGNLKAEACLLNSTDLCQALDTTPTTIYKWRDRNGLPLKESNLRYREKGKEKVYYIEVEEFWQWAKENRDLIDFSRFKRHILLPEPDWLDDAIKNNICRWPRRWSKEDDNRLWNLYYGGMKCKDIGEVLDRTELSVRHRLMNLRRRKFRTFKK